MRSKKGILRISFSYLMLSPHLRKSILENVDIALNNQSLRLPKCFYLYYSRSNTAECSQRLDF